MKVLSETELIKQILAGNEEAKTRFYQSHVNRLKPICAHFLGFQDSDAEDIIQQTFLIAFQKLPEFEPRSTLYTWLAHICVNLCYERIRRRKRVLVSLEQDMELLTIKLAEQRMEKLEEDQQMERNKEWVNGLIRNMGEKCRRIIEMRDGAGKSYAAIGKNLKIPIGTVMSQLARCREMLKELIRQSLEGEMP